MHREELIEEIKKLIKEKVRPILVMDGGNIKFIGLTDGNVVQVELQGACHGCPMSAMTLKHSVEEMLREHFPEIKKVENIEQDHEDDELKY